MRKGCLWGLGCLVVLAVLPVLLPAAAIGLLFLVRLLEKILGAI